MKRGYDGRISTLRKRGAQVFGGHSRKGIRDLSGERAPRAIGHVGIGIVPITLAQPSAVTVGGQPICLPGRRAERKHRIFGFLADPNRADNILVG